MTLDYSFALWNIVYNLAGQGNNNALSASVLQYFYEHFRTYENIRRGDNLCLILVFSTFSYSVIKTHNIKGSLTYRIYYDHRKILQ